LSHKTDNGVKANEDQIKPRKNHNLSLEEILSVITMINKDTSKEIVHLGRTRRRKIRETKDPMMMKIP